MKKLIVARHGEYGYANRLTEKGKQDTIVLAKKLKKSTGNGASIVLTSDVNRAIDSAQIFASVFEADYQEYEVLYSDGDNPPRNQEVSSIITPLMEQYETIILVSHSEYVGWFPIYFSRKYLKIELISKLIGKSEAWVIDCADSNNPTLTHVR